MDPLPLTEDLVKLASGTKDKIGALVRDLSAASLPARTLKAHYNQLVQLTCAAVIQFNKRRGGEGSKIMIKTYQERQKSQPNQDIVNHLTPLEQELAKKMDLVEVVGKRKRRVPVLLAPYMKNAINMILQIRELVGVSPENPFVFAKPGSKGHVKGWDAIRFACDQESLQKPELITSTKLRKYLATVTQVMNLDDNQLEWVANHLGHSLQVHRAFCRLPSEVLQVCKVSQLLLAAESGAVHQYADKTLEDINIRGKIFKSTCVFLL